VNSPLHRAAVLMARALSVVVVGALSAGATVLSGRQSPPSGEAIIRAMHDRYAKTWYHTLSFSQKTMLRTPADTMVEETWKEVALLPGRLRVDMERATGPMTGLYAGDSLFFIKGDSTVNRVAARNILLIMGFDVYAQPAERTLAQLHEEHYALTPVREDTWEGRAVYVIGAPAGDLHSHQLWIDKDRLLFVRAIQPGTRDSTVVVDFRFDNYVQLPTGWIAELVETYVGTKLVQREEYSDVRTNIPVDERSFVPPGGR
jgi:hypothetical protein